MERKSFKEGFLADLKMRANIVDVISKYTEVNKKGNLFWARCPFHFEKTASFCIYGEQGAYKCFGCGESGDVITFIQKIENVNFIDAVEHLANMANVEIQYSNDGKDNNFAKQLKDKKLILSALEKANDFYNAQLYSDKAHLAQEYIKKRKLNKTSLEEFRIGYSPDYSSIVKVLKKDFDENLLIDAGILNRGTSNTYDVQSERLTFALLNPMGQVVGFSGRILTDNKELAKYKNTKTTMVFDKSKTFFGLYQATKSKAIEKFNGALLVEGQIDVIMLHQNGYQNAIATLGTAFTENHAYQLKRINKNITICYDGDLAGQKATWKAGEILFSQGFRVKVASLPSGVDPDEFLRNCGKEKFDELLKNAEEFMDFKLRKWAEQMNISSNFDKTEYIKKSIQLLSTLDTMAEAEIYLPVIKKWTNVPIDVLREALSKEKNTNEKNSQSVPREQQNPVDSLFVDAYQKADRFVLASLLLKKEYVSKYDISELEFNNPDYQSIYLKILEKRSQNTNYLLSDIYDDFDVENSENIKHLVGFRFSDNEEINEKYYKESVIQNSILKLKKLSDRLENEYTNCQELTTRTKLAQQLMEVKTKLKEKEKELKN